MYAKFGEKLTYYAEKKEYVSGHQSRFRRERNTIYSVLRLEHEIRKAQVSKESVVAVFFDKEKAYDMMQREGLTIKLSEFGKVRYIDG